MYGSRCCKNNLSVEGFVHLGERLVRQARSRLDPAGRFAGKVNNGTGLFRNAGTFQGLAPTFLASLSVPDTAGLLGQVRCMRLLDIVTLTLQIKKPVY